MMENNPEYMRKLFWVLWSVLLVLLPLYLFTLLFSFSDVDLKNLVSVIPVVIGGFTVVAQIIVHISSFKQAEKGLPLSRHYLTLLVGTSMVAIVWLGGCFVFGFGYFNFLSS